tara:strand:+ start:6440 stop:7126 length:687 start_codon:yes stop_codon:yes gene_type:complete
MKKNLLIMIILAIISCSTNENNMTISGNVDGLMKGTLYLQYEKDSTIVNLDSIYLKGKSEYKLKTNITEPDLYYLYLDKEDGDTLNDIIMFFGENGEIEINSRLSNFDSSYEIIGSKNSDLLIEYNSIMRQYNFQNLDLLQIFYQAQINNNQQRIDSVNIELENLIRKKYLYSLNFSITNSENEVSPYIAVSQIPDANINLLRKLYDTLPNKIKNSKYGKILKKITID